MIKILILGRTQFLYNTAVKISEELSKVAVCGIVTAKAAPEYTKKEKDFFELASKIGVPFFTSLKDKNLCEYLKKVKVDIGVSVNWPLIIGEDFIKLFKLGVLNAHMGDLPRYRGNACPNWAIINGEEKVALTVHLMEGGKLDCGRVIFQSYFNVNENTYIEDIYSWAEKEIPRLFCKAIDILKDNPGYSLKYVSENDPESLRCYPRRPEDGKIDWDRDAEYIHRLIRASGYPFAGAFSFLDGKEKITIWRAELYDDGEKFLAVPGQIAELGKNYFVVITGKGKLKITKWDCKSLICSIRQRLI